MAMQYNRIFNFSAGPSMLPVPVLERCRDEMLNYRGSGMSVMEMSHRSKVFEEIAVNAGRGYLIDEDALLRGLESGRVRAAGLDVYAAEPTANSALTSHPRVTCTPHIGAAAAEAQQRVGAELVSIIDEICA